MGNRIFLGEVGQNVKPWLCSVKNQQTGEEEKRMVVLCEKPEDSFDERHPSVNFG